MKTFVVVLASVLAVSFAFPQDAVPPANPDEPEIAVRAPSTFQNCDCQCDSYTWTSNGKILGNCLTADASGANFCYVSGSAARACRDVQTSHTRTDSFSDRGKFYSYEACATPPRNLCRNGSPLNPNQNFGDGDLVGGFGAGGYPGGAPGPINRPGGLGAILGVRTAGEGGEAGEGAAGDAVDNTDPEKITFAEA